MSIIFADQNTQHEFLRTLHHEREIKAQGNTLERATWGHIFTWLPRPCYMRAVLVGTVL